MITILRDRKAIIMQTTIGKWLGGKIEIAKIPPTMKPIIKARLNNMLNKCGFTSLDNVSSTAERSKGDSKNKRTEMGKAPKITKIIGTEKVASIKSTGNNV